MLVSRFGRKSFYESIEFLRILVWTVNNRLVFAQRKGVGYVATYVCFVASAFKT